MISDVKNPRANQKEKYRVEIYRFDAMPIIKKCDTMDEAMKIVLMNFRGKSWSASITNMEQINEFKKSKQSGTNPRD